MSRIALVEHFNLVLELFFGHPINLRGLAELRRNSCANHVLAASEGAGNREHRLGIGAIVRTNSHGRLTIVVAYGSGYRYLVIMLVIERLEVRHSGCTSTNLADILGQLLLSPAELPHVDCIVGIHAICEVGDTTLVTKTLPTETVLSSSAIEPATRATELLAMVAEP